MVDVPKRKDKLLFQEVEASYPEHLNTMLHQIAYTV